MSSQSASVCAWASTPRICISSIRKAAMHWFELKVAEERKPEMIRRLCATATFAVLLVCHALDAQSAAPAPTTAAPTGIYDPSLDARVETLLSKMTLEEKVGQLAQFSAGQPTGPGTGRTDYEDMIAKGQIGALFNIATAKETNAYQRIAMEKSRLRIPIVFG